MLISDWSSDVCSSDLAVAEENLAAVPILGGGVTAGQVDKVGAVLLVVALDDVVGMVGGEADADRAVSFATPYPPQESFAISSEPVVGRVFKEAHIGVAEPIGDDAVHGNGGAIVVAGGGFGVVADDVILGIEPGPAGGVLPAQKAGAGLDRAAAIDDLAAIVVLGRALAARPVGEALVGRDDRQIGRAHV